MQKIIHNSQELWSVSVAGLLLVALASALRADDWMTWASTYTHDPQTGYRVDQYAPGEQPISPYRQDFTRSGYRHFRSTLQAGQSADNMHIVEQWGQPVVPYEQWRFPFRPYAVPYDAWGPQAPYGITNGSFQYGLGGGHWGGGAHGHAPIVPRPGYGPGLRPGEQTQPGHAEHGGAGYPDSNPAGAAGWGGRGWGDNHSGGHGRGDYPPHGGYGPNHPNRYPYPYPDGSRGFPLTPTYNNEPWYDGSYPTVPPLGER